MLFPQLRQTHILSQFLLSSLFLDSVNLSILLDDFLSLDRLQSLLVLLLLLVVLNLLLYLLQVLALIHQLLPQSLLLLLRELNELLIAQRLVSESLLAQSGHFGSISLHIFLAAPKQFGLIALPLFLGCLPSLAPVADLRVENLTHLTLALFGQVLLTLDLGLVALLVKASHLGPVEVSLLALRDQGGVSARCASNNLVFQRLLHLNAEDCGH